MNPTEIVLDFLERINQHDADRLAGIFGAAGGTISANGKVLAENKWRTPAAWLAVVHNGLVKQWRVYADNKPVYAIVAKLKLTADS